MGSTASRDRAEVWPPDWEDMSEAKRQAARDAILSLSGQQPEEFMLFAKSKYAIPPDQWQFEEYHAAAAAAVQEDIKLNRIIYKCVPRRCEESEFWRIYFSQVLHVLECVKKHGQYPPPPPPPEAVAAKSDDKLFRRGEVRAVERPPVVQSISDTCSLM